MELFLSAEALTFLDKLWAVPTLTLGEIRTRMQSHFGMQFTQEQLRDAARRNDVVAAETKPAIPLSAMTPRRAVRKAVEPVRTMVVRERFPVPVGGFSMFNKGNVR